MKKMTEANDDRAEGQHILCWLSLLLLAPLPMCGTGFKQPGKQPSLWCSYIFTQQLLQLFHMHTQDLTAFTHQDPDCKLYAPSSCRVVSHRWYRMITEHTSVIIRILPCRLLPSTNISLPNNWDSTGIFGNAIKCSFAHICDFSL